MDQQPIKLTTNQFGSVEDIIRNEAAYWFNRLNDTADKKLIEFIIEAIISKIATELIRK